MKICVFFRIAFLSVVVVTMAGCASYVVPLNYKMLPDTHLHKAETQKPIKVMPVNDLRDDTKLLLHEVDTQYVGVGIPITHEFNYYANQPLSNVVEEALKGSLEKSGYNVVWNDSKVNISVNILNGKCVSTNYLVHNKIICVLRAQVRLMNPKTENLLWSHFFNANGKIDLSVFFNNEKKLISESLNSAINKLVQQILNSNSFRAALKRA